MRRLATLVLGISVLGWLLVAPARAAERDTLLIHKLLGLDYGALLPESEQNPLAELEAWSNLYVATLAAAASDASPDKRDLKTFMLIGWIARARNDFATIEAFNSDFKALFDRRPDFVLRAMAENEYVVASMCSYLAGHFFFEDNRPEDREPFIAGHRDSIAAILGADRAKLCLDAFWSVKS